MTTKPNPLYEAYLNREVILTPAGRGVIKSWERFYPLRGWVDEYVESIEVALLDTDGNYHTDDVNNIRIIERP